MKETVAPPWMRKLVGLVSMIAVLFIGWLAFEMHEQDEARLTQDLMISKQLNDAAKSHTQATAELSEKIDNIKYIFAASVSEITNKVEKLSLELDHVKEIAVSRSKDRWTGRDALARNDLVDARTKARSDLIDERCKTVDRRLKEIEDTVEKLHKSESI